MEEYHFIVLADNEQEATNTIRQGVYASIEKVRVRKEWR